MQSIPPGAPAANETRQIHGVAAGSYVLDWYGLAQNSERNALAFLLTLPWTKELRADSQNMPQYNGREYPTHDDLDSLLVQAQAAVPALTRRKLRRAIRILALANPLVPNAK